MRSDQFMFIYWINGQPICEPMGGSKFAPGGKTSIGPHRDLMKMNFPRRNECERFHDFRRAIQHYHRAIRRARGTPTPIGVASCMVLLFPVIRQILPVGVHILVKVNLFSFILPVGVNFISKNDERDLMANENSNRKKIQFWITEEQKAVWDEYLLSTGISLTDFLKTAAHEFIQSRTNPISSQTLRELAGIREQKEPIQAESELLMKRMIEQQQEQARLISEILNKRDEMPSDEAKGRVLTLISKTAGVNTKEISSLLEMTVTETVGILQDLKGKGLVRQNPDMAWTVN